MHELLDEYENKITPTAGKEFKALYRYYSIGEINSEEQEVLNSASYDGLMQATVRLIVFRTVKALKTVMGEHILKYLPEKKDGSYARMDRLLSLRNN